MEKHQVPREKIDLILEKPEVKKVIERLGIGEIKSGLEESRDGFLYRFSNITEGKSISGIIRIGIDERGYFISFDIETLKGRRKDDDYIRFVYDLKSNIEVIRNVATKLSLDSEETIKWAHRYERDPKHIHLVTESELWGGNVKNIKKRVIDLTRSEGDIATLTGAIGGKKHDPKEDDKEVKKRLQKKLKSTRDPEGCRVYCNIDIDINVNKKTDDGLSGLREKIDLILEKPEVKKVIERLGIGEIKSGLEESQDGFWFRFSNTTEGENRSGSIRIGIDNRGYFISFDIETLKGRRKDDDYIRFVYDLKSNIEVIRNEATNLSLDSESTIRWAYKYERNPNHIHLVTESKLWGDDVKNIKKRVIDLTRKEGDIATLTGAIGGKEHAPKEDDKEVKKRLQEKLKSTRDPEGCRVYCDGNRNIGR